MSRYIDTDKLKRHGKGDLFSKSLWRMGMHDTNVRPRTMANTSTNDVELVIRCKDCKHFINHDKRCGLLNHGMKINDYCSYAERKMEHNG